MQFIQPERAGGEGMSKKISILLNCIYMILATLNILCLLAVRPVWTYINQTIPASISLTIILISVNVVFVILAILRLSKSSSKVKTGSKRVFLAEMIAVLFSICLSVVNVYILMEMGSNKQIAYDNLMHYLKTLIMIIPWILVLLVSFLYPRFKYRNNKIFIWGACILSVIAMIIVIGDFGRVRITSGPIIQGIDENNFAVIWTTNYKSTGIVEYGSDEGSLKSITSNENGLIDVNTTTHKVVISTNSKNVMLRVASTRIKELSEGGVKYRNTAKSDFVTVDTAKGDENVSFYTLSDVHGNKNIYEKFLSNKDYSFALLNGDALDCIERSDSFIKQVLKPASQYTKSKPLYIVRGNHETRGGYARELSNSMVLPNGRYFYSFKAGPVFAIVLDSGDGNDTVSSDDLRYGLTSFKEYRDEQTQWLKEVCNSEEYKNATFKIAFIHAPLQATSEPVIEEENMYISKWREIFNTSKIDAVLSGHTHVPEVIQPDGKLYKYPNVIGGGHSNEDYMAIKTEATQSQLKISFVNMEGEEQEVYNISK